MVLLHELHLGNINLAKGKGGSNKRLEPTLLEILHEVGEHILD
eukprot:CAMPEP_0174268638 /NCGR_PEP_ID=MMETSP0439-20130205/38173_1 /TAXON_ID=0 /ORGANISM="Stereomyxa ramosa, Strain Chinc5" /LENGTH=42 /DNA_ID= /DNA_START= /DNA_END= /DNA_ORIENTATION=